MSTRYRKLWESDTYKAEIYDNCTAALFVRSDGERARWEVDTTYWQGNTGGFSTQKVYIKGRDQVRRAVRALRQAQVSALKMGDGRKASYIPEMAGAI